MLYLPETKTQSHLSSVSSLIIDDDDDAGVFIPAGQGQQTMQSSGHRFRDVEHHPLLADNDSYDSSSSSEADMADRVWFIRDGCGMVCAIMTWLLVVYADFVVTFVMLLPSKDFWYSVINGVLFNCLAVLALSSHLRTMLTDPVSIQEFLGIGLSPPSAQKFGEVIPGLLLLGKVVLESKILVLESKSLC